METALCTSWSQITDGDEECFHCDNPASVTISTGADPEETPMCWEHGRQMIDSGLHLGDVLFGAAK